MRYLIIIGLIISMLVVPAPGIVCAQAEPPIPTETPTLTPTPTATEYPTITPTYTPVLAVEGMGTLIYEPTQIAATVTPWPTPTLLPTRETDPNSPDYRIAIEADAIFSDCGMSVAMWTIQSWNSYVSQIWPFVSSFIIVISTLFMIYRIIKHVKQQVES